MTKFEMRKNKFSFSQGNLQLNFMPKVCFLLPDFCNKIMLIKFKAKHFFGADK